MTRSLLANAEVMYDALRKKLSLSTGSGLRGESQFRLSALIRRDATGFIEDDGVP
jgi:hypothetical protein